MIKRNSYNRQLRPAYLISLCLLFFVAQLFLTYKGVTYFGMFVNPFLLLVAFVAQFIVYIISVTNCKVQATELKFSFFKVAMFVAGAVALVVCFPSFKDLFHAVPEPGKGSDVIPQLEIQFDRFSQGTMPYQQMVLSQSKPFPVYMPLHWLPVAISKYTYIDTRWSGLLLLLPVAGLCAYVTARKAVPTTLSLLAVCLLPAVLFTGAYAGDTDMALSLETIVAAYYLVLCAGLLQRNLVVVAIGLVLCFLSRYTLIFWMPTFLVLLYINSGFTKTARIVFILIAAVCCFYVFPFLLKDPSIFMTGLKYHNGAAEFEWEYGAYTFNAGIYFAPHINAMVEGTYAHKVLVARMCQAVAMLLLCAGSILYYRRVKDKISFYDYLPAILYLFLVGFYMIGPLTYRYYMLTPLMLSALLCMKIIIAGYSSSNAAGNSQHSGRYDALR